MARIHGRRGRLYVGLASDTASAEPVPYIKEFSVESASEKVDVTAFGDGTKVYVAGLADATGSYAGFLDDSTNQLFTASTDGLARKFYWYPSTSNTAKYTYGTAFFDFSEEYAVDGAVSISGNWSAASTVYKV